MTAPKLVVSATFLYIDRLISSGRLVWHGQSLSGDRGLSPHESWIMKE